MYNPEGDTEESKNPSISGLKTMIVSFQQHNRYGAMYSLGAANLVFRGLFALSYLFGCKDP